MSQGSRHRDRITEEASLWFVRAQDPDFTDEDRNDLAGWLAGSAEHVQEYLQLAAITADLHELPATPSVDELIALASETGDEQNVVVLADREPVPVRVYERSVAQGNESPAKRRRPTAWAAAASVLLAVAVGLWVYIASGPTIYSTGVGEQVSFPLEDGSVVTLNAQSSLEIAYTDTERNVRLMAGEVLFNVEKDRARPFQVVTERAMIRAVGTAFNVRHRDGGTTVTVVEGTVDVQSLREASRELPGARSPSDDATDRLQSVSIDLLVDKVGPVRLAVGQQARVDRQTRQVTVLDTDVEKATSWRERRLVFGAWRLADVVEEFNLYNEQRIVISDKRLAERRISGTFSADDRNSFALFLDETGIAVSDTRADGTIVLRAPGSAP